MTLNDYLRRKQRCRGAVRLTRTTYPQNIQRIPLPLWRGGRWVAFWCGEGIRRPVSRVLCRSLAETRRSFLWTAPRGTVLATYPDPSERRRSCPLARARDPYSVLLLAGLAVQSLLPATRWALTPPFHPYPSCERRFAFCGA